MTNPALEIRGLRKAFPQFKLGPLDLTVPSGVIYGLIGPNGAGKTTTIDLVMGIGRYDAGQVRVLGLDPREREAEAKARVGYVSPDLSYALWRKVRRLISFVRQFYPSWDEEYCRRLLGRLGIGWDDHIKTMSLGTRVKLALVVALAHKPDLLLLDEPTLGVDAVSKREIFSELLAAVQDERRTVLITSHGLADLERFADHLGFLHHGRLLLEGPTARILERYRMVDVTFAGTSLPSGLNGVRVQGHSGNRWRLLVDMESGGAEAIRSRVTEPLSTSALTLEELFVTLVKED